MPNTPNGREIPKIKTKSNAKLKKELDKFFSLYIRQKNADKEGNCVCYTCGVKKHWKEMQNGHFVSRGHTATRWSYDNCRVQCVGCNVFGGGKLAVYATKLESELGVGTVSRLYREAQAIVKDIPFIEKIDYYKQELNKLKI